MKRQHTMEEVEKSIEDKHERSKVLEGLLGYILNSTQVSFISTLSSMHIRSTTANRVFLLFFHLYAGGSCRSAICSFSCET